MGRRRKREANPLDLIGPIVVLIFVLAFFGAGGDLQKMNEMMGGVFSMIWGVVILLIIAGVGFLIFLLIRKLIKARFSHTETYYSPYQPPNQATRSYDPNTIPVPDPIRKPPQMSDVELSRTLRAIDWFQFEKLVELIFKDLGYVVTRKGGAHADGGIDLVIEKDGLKLGVQCKHWRTWNVRPKEVREFIGALKVAGLSSGYYVTLQGCTEAAEDLATEQMIQFVDESQILNSIRSGNGQVKPEMLRLLNDKSKYCPRCESVMLLRTGRKTGKQFWGCSTYPQCDGKVWMDD
ncbi:MAG: hypothetical protein EXS18_07675 [Verrucomicrobiae bacterium]|nr:hypothetical protein [Verrucomicrobiae bacterium]